MKIEDIEISEFKPCKEWLDFRKNYPDFKSAWEACPRGDWMLWIAGKLGIDIRILTTAKALCANTVRHLMKDERSRNAIDVALKFGKEEASLEELKSAAYAAFDAAYAAYTSTSASSSAYASAFYASASAASSASYAAYASAVYASAYAADASAYAADSAAYAADSAAKKENQKQTADICRTVLTEAVFKAIENLKPN